MCRITSTLLLAFGVFAVACSTSGYSVDVRGAFAPPGPDLVDQLKAIAKRNEFTAIQDGRESAACAGEFVSEYWKALSDAPHDRIIIAMFVSDSEKCGKHVNVTIYHELRGMQEPVKSQIESLGNEFYEALSTSGGAARVTVERTPLKLGFRI